MSRVRGVINVHTLEECNVCQDGVLSLKDLVLIVGRGCDRLPAERHQGLWNEGRSLLDSE